MEVEACERGAAVIEDMFRAVAMRRPIWRAPLALLVLGGALFFALSSGPAEAATTFSVISTGDEEDANLANATCDVDVSQTGSQCTLRAAIQEANDTAGADTIAFDIGATGAQTINVGSTGLGGLPAITDTITIDGYSQPGARPNNLAEGNDARLNVLLDGLNAGSGVDGLRIEAADSTIKGLLIRRFDQDGIQITGAGATGNRIEGNFIGVNRDGITDRGNGRVGIEIDSASNTVGGVEPEMRNVISGNGVYGVHIFGAGAIENRVEGNYVGTTADGSGALGNAGSGVLIDNGANLTAVGGRTPPGAGNRIAHNGLAGVTIASSNSTSTVGNHILSNSIFANDGLGIDLRGGTEGANGVTANDTNDADTGPNSLQNFPVIRSATKNPASPTTTISGRLNSDSSQDFVIQCFLTNGAPASAHGDGSRLLKTVLVSTNASGNASFSCVSSLPILGQVPGQTVSATATNIVTGDSSEFSKNRAITVGP